MNDIAKTLIVILAPIIILSLSCTLKKGEQSLIEPKMVEKGEKHPITLVDILSTREIAEQQISPNGEKVAFIVKQAFLELNDYRSALFTIDTTEGSKPKKLHEEKVLSLIKWSRNGELITFLSSKNGSNQVWHIPSNGGKSKELFHHSTEIIQYKWSSDGQKIAFVAKESIDEDEKQQIESRGVVYDDEFYNSRDIITKSWIKKPSQLWIYDLQQQEEKMIWEYSDARFSIIDIEWSPDGKWIAIVYSAPPKFHQEPLIAFDSDIGVISIDSNEFVSLLARATADRSPTWSPDSKSFAFISFGQSKPSLSIMKLEDKKPMDLLKSYKVSFTSKLYWSRDGNKVLFEGDDRSTSAFYEIPSTGGVFQKISQGDSHFSKFSLNTDQTIASCIQQTTMTPPEITVVEIKNGSFRTLTELNPQYQNISLGEVSELRWKNKYGYETNGFLIKPIGYIEGKRYPFLLILYGFSGEFIHQAQWNTSFPAQVFAANGFTVLLMNYPRYPHHWDYGDFQTAGLSEAYSPLASIEKAVETVVDMGIADPNKKGILGWSYGSFLTDFTITHRDLFEAASSGEGGLYGPGLYWAVGSKWYRDYMEGVMGGSPYGKEYKNYIAFSPALNAHRVRIPVMREYTPEGTKTALEFYTGLRKHGVQVELVIYPGEGHVFSQPIHRLASMQRNLDWFNFWLMDKKDADPKKERQYKRWNSMNEQLLKEKSR